MEQKQSQPERQTAKILSIKELSEGQYIKQDGWDPNYVHTKRDDKVSRVNIIGIIVTIPDNSESIFIDDGTSKIEVRTFEQQGMFEGYSIGDNVLIIGRPRIYNDEIYINAETISKINNKGWLEYRKKMITLRNLEMPEKEIPQKAKEENSPPETKEEETKNEETVEDEYDIVLSKIKSMDNGEGCNVDALAKEIDNADKIVEELLKKGEIFEITSGKVKVLE